MKHRFFTLCVLFSFFLLAGCLTDKELFEREDIQLTGVLKNLGEVVVEKKADHLLINESGDVFYVYSPFLNLDDGKYLNMRVQIVGEVVDETDSGKSIVVVKSIVVLDDALLGAPMLGALPKKYMSQEMGFQLEGLIDFQVVEKDHQVVFSKKDAELTVTRYDNPTSMTLYDWLGVNEYTSAIPTQLGPDQMKAYKIVNSTAVRYFVSRTNAYIYDVYYEAVDVPVVTELQSVVNSFRFVPLE